MVNWRPSWVDNNCIRLIQKSLHKMFTLFVYPLCEVRQAAGSMCEIPCWNAGLQRSVISMQSSGPHSYSWHITQTPVGVKLGGVRWQWTGITLMWLGWNQIKVWCGELVLQWSMTIWDGWSSQNNCRIKPTPNRWGERQSRGKKSCNVQTNTITTAAGLYL